MTSRTNRRDFLKVTAAASVGFWAAGGVQVRPSRAAMEEIHFAAIGVGGRGTTNSNDAARAGKMVAICDIDKDILNRAAARFSQPKTFIDFRELLHEVGDSIDAVTVSTPDHTHAVAAAMAMEMGKHCFTEKPLTRTIWEARRLGEIAKEKGVATQMGNQGTANNGLRHAAAIVKEGAIGEVSEVHVWTNRPVWPQGLDRPDDTPSIPTGGDGQPLIHWDEWIGPAEYRPYHPAYHPFRWRGWWDFGTGALGDMACHTLNMPFFALNLRNPTSVVAETAGHNKETFPTWSVIEFQFPETDGRPALKLVWYDGGKLPPDELRAGAKSDPNAASGALLIGSEGTLYSPGDYASEIEILGRDDLPEAEFERSPGHFEEWVRAIRGEKPAMANFPDAGSPLTETILLGNLAVWADGEKVEWDAENLKVTNSDAYDELVKPTYREGYSLDGMAKV